MSEARILWELKEKAKWSHDTGECKMAVSELSKYGEKAIPVLEEVLSIAAYEEVKAACIEAIKAVNKKQAAELNLADLPP